MPQIIMVNHAAWVNYERSDRRYKAKREVEPGTHTVNTAPTPLPLPKKDFASMTSDEIAAYTTGE